jgi:hypothetical protein
MTRIGKSIETESKNSGCLRIGEINGINYKGD